MVARPKQGRGMTRKPLNSFPPPLAPGTIVQRTTQTGMVITGTVQHYHADALPAQMGMFPVLWVGGQWATYGADDVRIATHVENRQTVKRNSA